MKRLPAYLLACLMLSACIYPLDIESEDNLQETLVIDGTIIIGAESTIKLSRMIPLKDDGKAASPHLPSRIKASVTLENDGGLSITKDNFPYAFDTSTADPEKSYRLTVVCDGKTYRTSWIKPMPAPKITSVDFSADDTNVFVKLSLDGTQNGLGYASAQYDAIWKFHADYVRILDYVPEENAIVGIEDPDYTFYECWMKIIGRQQTIIDYAKTGGIAKDYPLLFFPRTSNRNHYNYNILVKVRNLTEQEYRYWKQLNDSDGQASTLFSPEPANAPSNLICESDPSVKVFGYVGVSRMEYYIASIGSEYLIYGQPPRLTVIEPEDYYYYYSLGYYPITVTTGGFGWGPKSCFNCVSAGGTLQRPSFDLPKDY